MEMQPRKIGDGLKELWTKSIQHSIIPSFHFSPIPPFHYSSVPLFHPLVP